MYSFINFLPYTQTFNYCYSLKNMKYKKKDLNSTIQIVLFTKFGGCSVLVGRNIFFSISFYTSIPSLYTFIFFNLNRAVYIKIFCSVFFYFISYITECKICHTLIIICIQIVQVIPNPKISDYIEIYFKIIFQTVRKGCYRLYNPKKLLLNL